MKKPSVQRQSSMDDKYKEDLGKAVKMVMEHGLSTGHADTFSELMAEVLATVKKLRKQVVSQSYEIDRLSWYDHD